ncbi:MAG: DUF1573 domain-containing protein [Planctomycetota bacterium]
MKIFAGLVAFMAFGVVSAISLANSQKPKPAVTKLLATPTSPLSRVPEKEFDFGVMPPDERGSHDFVVENHGVSSLTLKKSGTSCECTKVVVQDSVIPPGGRGIVTVAWTVVSKSDTFLNSAVIKTNDPKRDEIRFTIKGRVAHELSPIVDLVSFDTVPPGETAVVDFVLFSEEWGKFTIEDIVPSIPDMEIIWDEADESLLSPLNGRSGKKIILGLPSNLDHGRFFESIEIHAVAEDGTREQVRVPLTGVVLRRLSLYGPDITTKGVIEIGKLDYGKGGGSILSAKVRDDEKSLKVTAIHTEPSFVEADFVPSSPEKGLYRLTVRVPKDAPEGSHLDHNHGKLILEFDHPRIKDIELGLHFAVMPKE